MTNTTYGSEVDWGTAELPGELGNRESDFMTTEEGDNEIRILSNPRQKYVHWVVDEVGKKRKIDCALDGCPVCKRGQDGDKAKAVWLTIVLSRKDNKVKILEIGSQIFAGIKKLVNNPKWGSVAEYDLNINRGPKDSKPLYTVMPSPRTPLTTEEKKMLLAFNERVDITKFVTPPTPALVCEKLGWAEAIPAKTVNSDFVPSKTQPQPQKKKPLIDFNFDD